MSAPLAKRTMRRNSFFLPALSMGLLYSALYMGMIFVNLRGSSRTGGGDPAVLLHFALIALVALGLSFAVKKSYFRSRPLAALLTVAGLGCMTVPFLSESILAQLFNGHPPVLAASMAVFTPVAFFLFFRAVPLGKEGFSFAIIMVCSEALWAFLFPLLGLITAQLQNLQALYLFSLCYWMVGGAGLCLAVTLVSFAAAAPDCPTPIVAVNAPRTGALPRKRSAVLGLAFAAGAGMSAMMGLHMGMFMPKIAMTPELLSIPHFILLLLIPVAGRLVDTHPGKLALVCLFSLAGVFLSGLAQAYGLIGHMSLFSPLNIVQQLVLLIIYTVTARLLKPHAFLPLMIVLVYCLYPVQLCGVALRGLVQGAPYGVTMLSLTLTAGTAWCLWRFRALLAEEPELWSLPRKADAATPVSEPELSAARPDYTSFGVRYSLSERESLVMSLLARGYPTEAIAADLQVTESTIRTYISRVLRKTGAGSRAALMEHVVAHGRMDTQAP